MSESHYAEACSGSTPATLSVAGVDPERNFGGGEAQVLGLTEQLGAMGHRAELLCDPAGELWRRARNAGISCTALRVRNAIDVGAALALGKILSGRRYDVVHFHTSRAHALAPWVRGLARAAVVTRRMDYVPNRLFARWLYGPRVVDGVAAISSGVADALASAGVARERITLLPSGVDCARFRPPTADERANARKALGLESVDRAVGAVGALEARKGHRYLLEAMALLGRGENSAGGISRARTAQHSAEGRVVAFIAGEGSLHDTLAAEISRLGLDDCVHLLGHAKDPRIVLWASDVFVMPSLAEGLGVSLLEAMACGLPAAAARVGGILDAVAEGLTGLMFEPTDTQALTRILSSLLRDEPARLAMGAAARARAVDSFSIETMARRTVELYRACLHTGSSTRRPSIGVEG